MKKTATLLALAGLSMTAKSENLHGSLRHSKVVDHTPESDPYVIINPDNHKDDELLLIYKPRFDLDPGMVIRPPRDDIDRGIFVKPRPANQVLYVDDELGWFPVHLVEHFASRGDNEVRIARDDANDELSLFHVKTSGAFGRSRGWGVTDAQKPLDAESDFAYKEGANSNTIDKPKDIGGMIIKEKGVAINEKHADDELPLFPTRTKPVSEWRSRSVDDELSLFPTKPIDLSLLGRGVRERNSNADDELSLFRAKPFVFSQFGRGVSFGNSHADDELSLFRAKPFVFSQFGRGVSFGNSHADDELRMLETRAIPSDQAGSRLNPIPVSRKLRGDQHADSELCHKDTKKEADSVKPKEVGGMIIKERGVNVQYGRRHDDADNELSWFKTKPIDESLIRRAQVSINKVVDDELVVLRDLLNDN